MKEFTFIELLTASLIIQHNLLVEDYGGQIKSNGPVTRYALAINEIQLFKVCDVRFYHVGAQTTAEDVFTRCSKVINVLVYKSLT